MNRFVIFLQAEQLESEKEEGIKSASQLRETLAKLEEGKNLLVIERNDLIAEKKRLLSERGENIINSHLVLPSQQVYLKGRIFSPLFCDIFFASLRV